MTEKEKMLAGLLYDPDIHLLANDRLYAQDLCFQLNQLSPLPKNSDISCFKRYWEKQESSLR